MNSKKNIVLYIDSSPHGGCGHLMRQLAMAQEARRLGFSVIFIYRDMQPSTIQRVEEEGFAAISAPTLPLCQVEEKFDACALIIDTYFLHPKQTLGLGSLSIPIVLFDDGDHTVTDQADFIVNPSFHTDPANYSDQKRCKELLLGPKYQIFRQEFLQASIPSFKERARFLLTFGGSDVKNLSMEISQSLLSLDSSLPLDLVLGALAADQEVAQAFHHYPQVKVHKDVRNMAQLMSQCGMAITSAGVTLKELIYMQVPSLALCLVDNQLPSIETALNGQAFIGVDIRKEHESAALAKRAYTLWTEAAKREKMSRFCQSIYQTNGVEEIFNRLWHFFS